MWAWCLPGNEVETVDMYMYNGVKLPALPDYDTDAYPYGFIAESVVMKGSYALYISDKPFVYNKLKNNMNPSDGSTVLYSPSYDGEDWQEFSDFARDGMPAPIWANYDVLDTNGDVHMEATEPAKLWVHAKSFLIGLALGMVGKPLPPSEREPVAFLYNGVRLPAFTGWDMEKCPYLAVIYRPADGENFSASLAMSSEPIFAARQPQYAFYGTLVTKVPAYHGVAMKLSTETEFEFWGTGWDANVVTDFVGGGMYHLSTYRMYEFEDGYVLWANHDIYTVDTGELCLAASEPVPVYE